MNFNRNYINKEWIDGTSVYTRTSPLNGSVIESNISNDYEVNKAVKSACSAFTKWHLVGIDVRIKYLISIAQILEKKEIQNNIVNAIQIEVGKPKVEAETEVIEVLDLITYFINNASENLCEKVNPIDSDAWPNVTSKSIFEPHGVIAFIKPWNYPFSNSFWGVIPALLAGNTIVFKPSELTSNTAQLIADLFHKADFPKGVFNLVCGDATTGQYLVAHPNINMISFTGSSQVGNKIHQDCVNRKIHCSLELGGNDAAIITSSANLNIATEGVAWGAFTNAGQVCTGIKRVIVNSNIYDSFVEKIVHFVAGLTPKCDISPLITTERANIVKEYVEDAKRKGGKILAGGELQSDFFMPPTVIGNCHVEMRLASEEVFGPILPIFKVENNSQAIALANNSKYGLGASVWVNEKSIGEEIAYALDVGMVWINEVNMPFPQAPWPGRKNSGPGIELSIYGLMEFVKIKHICSETSNVPREWWYPYK